MGFLCLCVLSHSWLKIKVNGIEEIPLYKYLKAQQGGGILGDDIKWNFTKFLVDADGKVIRRYKATDNPAKIEVSWGIELSFSLTHTHI